MLIVKRYLKWGLLSVASGFLAGCAAAVFLILLNLATEYRIGHLQIIWFLPLAGFVIGWIYHEYGKDVSAGNNLILDEIHDPKQVVPLKMAPFILIGTVLTHLFGGSAGREGTAVQMGGSLSDQLSKIIPEKWFVIEKVERKILLITGMGAGFGAAIGAPWAGIVFGMEVVNSGKLQWFALFECAIASFTAYYTTVLLRAPHTHYPQFDIPSLQWKTLFFVAVAGIIFGFAGRLFVLITHLVENFLNSKIKYPPLKPFLAGLLIVFLFWLEGSYIYAGLGLSHIQEALQNLVSFKLPLLKAGFTALTVGSGFKGGEFIPLVFIGATLGSALSTIIPVSLPLLSSMGFSAIFAGVSNTPIACTLMTMEIFGWRTGLYALIACFMSYYSSGYTGIYKSQKRGDKYIPSTRWKLAKIPRVS